MPLYEYECEADRSRFEVIQKFSDPPVTTCPNCGGPVRRLPSSPAIQFKGSGWYITDYARKGAGDGGKDPKDQKPASTTPSSDTARVEIGRACVEIGRAGPLEAGGRHLGKALVLGLIVRRASCPFVDVVSGFSRTRESA